MQMVGSEGTEAFEVPGAEWGGVPLGRASGPDHTGLNVGKESPHLGECEWAVLPVSAGGILDSEGAWWARASHPHPSTIPENQPG